MGSTPQWDVRLESCAFHKIQILIYSFACLKYKYHIQNNEYHISPIRYARANEPSNVIENHRIGMMSYTEGTINQTQTVAHTSIPSYINKVDYLITQNTVNACFELVG